MLGQRRDNALVSPDWNGRVLIRWVLALRGAIIGMYANGVYMVRSGAVSDRTGNLQVAGKDGGGESRAVATI